MHEHQWVFAGDLALTMNETESRGDVDLRRLEYCIDCGAIRVKFGNDWWFWCSDATKNYLSDYTGATHKVVPPPKGFRISPNSKLFMVKN